MNVEVRMGEKGMEQGRTGHAATGDGDADLLVHDGVPRCSELHSYLRSILENDARAFFKLFG